MKRPHHNIKQNILLTGATGYVGGRLLKLLQGTENTIRCLVRNPDHLRERTDVSVEIFKGDLLDYKSLSPAFKEIDIAYYLVHSLAHGHDFHQIELQSAKNFAKAAQKAGVKRIIYLSGLGHGEDLSIHLKSRHDVGRILRESGINTIELRAGVVIGSGSISFDMIRSLVLKLPVMITPAWTKIKTQPIGIEDILSYLLESITIDTDESKIIEVGCPEQVSYRNLMSIYAEVSGLKRLMLPVPVLTPYLSGLWLGLVTPLYARVGQKLIEGLKNETVVKYPDDAKLFPIKPMSISTAIKRAIKNEDERIASTRWSDALSSLGDSNTYLNERLGNRLIDSRNIFVKTNPETAFCPIRTIGGVNGWYFGNSLWKIRGFIDRIVGGPGLRRGRRDQEEIQIGETLDFWRVKKYERNQLLLLKAEMKVPGRAWLQFEIQNEAEGCRIYQTALFDPAGLAGLLYWYILIPFHNIMFRGMLRSIAIRAEM